MPQKRKVFKSQRNTAAAAVQSRIVGAVIKLPLNALGRRTLDFSEHLGKGFDDIVKRCMGILDEMLYSKTRSAASVAIYGKQGLPKFFEYLGARPREARSGMKLAQVDQALIHDYIGYLSRDPKLNYSTQKNLYSQLKSVLIIASRRQLLPAPHELFPENPYPQSNRRATGGAKPLSEQERQAVITALKKDLIAIYQGRFTRPMSEAMTVCFVTVSMRAGRNTTPLTELQTDAMKPHPFRPNLRLLRTTKRRGNNVSDTPIRKADVDDGAIQGDAVAIIELVLKLTHDLRSSAPKPLRKTLWLYRSEDQATLGQVMALHPGMVTKICRNIAERHGLRRADGSLLPIHPSAMRKTYTGRLWHLSGGDPFAVARLAGNSVGVLDHNYLAITPEMERDHSFLGEALVAGWRGKDTSSPAPVNTPVGRCKDPINGDMAPKDGNPCIDFTSCFSCRSYVITEEDGDLHRLYSYYWFLVRERTRIGSAKWAKYFGWIVRMIDDQVANRLDADRVSKAKARAKDNPHPFWKTPIVMEAASAT